ncbi:MAG: hypothetical protein ACRC41_13690 [Sarcina sp.]
MERILKLQKTYNKILNSTNGMSVNDMERAIESYYETNSFGVESIDKILDNINLDTELAHDMENKLKQALKKVNN